MPELSELFSNINISYSNVDEKVIKLVHEILLAIESEFCEREQFISIRRSLKNLSLNTMQELIMMCKTELHGRDTELHLKESINILAHYSVTNFRNTDEYYILQTIEVLENFARTIHQ